MWKSKYKRNLMMYVTSSVILIGLLLILSSKMMNTNKIYEDYKTAEVAYDQKDYIEAQRIYQNLYNQTKFNYFFNEINRVLQTEEMVFIKDSIDFLEEEKAAFEWNFKNREIAGMLETYDLFLNRSKEIKQVSNENNITSYNRLEEDYNLQALFANRFRDIWKEFQDYINQSIAIENFEEEKDFILFSSVLGKVTQDTQKTKDMMKEEMQKYYVAKFDAIIKKDDFNELVEEAIRINDQYDYMMEVEWVADKVTNFTIEKMKVLIGEKNYVRYNSYGERYFAYISKFPTYAEKKSKVVQLVNDQLASDVKTLRSYISKNKFEEAIALYDSIEEYIDMTDKTDIDMIALKLEIEKLWMKHDPIRMFAPLELTEISKGKSKWGRQTYVLATDQSKRTLYWGEVNAKEEIKTLSIALAPDATQDIYISDALSVNGKPVIMVEGINEYRESTYSVYEVLEEGIKRILYMRTDSYESRAQGQVIIGRDVGKTELEYYQYDGSEFIHTFDLGDVSIGNKEPYGGYSSNPQNRYSYYEVGYIYFNTEIKKGNNNSNSLDGTLYVDYIDPYGNVIHPSGSDDSHTKSFLVNTRDTQEVEYGLGSQDYGSYSPGRYKVQVWWNYMMIAERYFEVFE